MMKRNDLILIGGILLVGAIALVYLFFFRPAGEKVEITIDGDLYKTYSLAENVTEEIHTEGGNCNTLIIRDGKAMMESATCPDGICVDHSPIFREGESIVCLPNRVVVTVVGDGGEAPDVVV